MNARTCARRVAGLRRYASSDAATLDAFVAASGSVRLVETDVLDVSRVRSLEATVPRFAAPARPLEPNSVLPPLWHLALFQPKVPGDRLRADGTERNDPRNAASAFMPPSGADGVDLERMWASGQLEWSRTDPLRVGDEVEQVTTIAEVKRKAGSRGEMIFVTQRKELRRLANKAKDAPPSLVEMRTHVFRPPAPKPDAATSSTTRDVVSTTPPERPAADFEHVWTPDAIALFRFSAITFNSHRIHYDHRYCTDVEGRPGLVVHGPLTATILAQLAHSHPPPKGPGALTRFAYRATSPLIADRPIRYSGVWDPEGRSARLTAEGDDGKTAMTATATYE